MIQIQRCTVHCTHNAPYVYYLIWNINKLISKSHRQKFKRNLWITKLFSFIFIRIQFWSNVLARRFRCLYKNTVNRMGLNQSDLNERATEHFWRQCTRLINQMRKDQWHPCNLGEMRSIHRQWHKFIFECVFRIQLVLFIGALIFIKMCSVILKQTFRSLSIQWNFVGFC